MFLNDVDIEKLTVERPFNVYKDFLGHELLHTYHPSYWNLINIDMEQVILDFILTYIIHSGFISGYQNRYGDNLKPPTNVYHRMTA